MPSSLVSHASLPAERLAALVVARAGAIVLALGGPARWRKLQSYTLAPIELPGVGVPPGAMPAGAAESVATRLLGGRARVLPSACTYGRTAAHAIDRIEGCPLAGPAPLIYLERGLSAEDTLSTPQRAEVCVYRGALDGDPQPGGEASGLLWLPLTALRQAIRGLPLADLLGMRGVTWQPAPDAVISDDLFVFVTAEYGERHLLRVAAKYGARAVFQEERESDRGA